MKFAAAFTLIIFVGCGALRIGGRSSGPSGHDPMRTSSPGEFEFTDMAGLFNFLANMKADLKADVEAVGVKITNTNYGDPWALRMLIAGMVASFGGMIGCIRWVVKNGHQHRLADSAIDRMAETIYVNKDQKGVGQVIDRLKAHADETEKYLHNRVQKVKGRAA